MRFTVPIALGLLGAGTVALTVPHEKWMLLAWAGLCVTIVLSVVDVIVWQTVKGLDDYATRFQGPSSALETVLSRVWARKKTAILLFLLNFLGRGFSGTVFGAVTAGKIIATAHSWIFCGALGVIAFSLPILTQQLFSYFSIGRELGQQMLKARRDTERVEELKRAGERPPPTLVSDEHTSGYTKVAPWK